MRSKQDRQSQFSGKAPSAATVCDTGVLRAWRSRPGTPLVPIRLVGTARALSRGRIGFPQLRIIFGEPIKVARAQEESVAATKLTERLRAAVESLA